MNSSILKSLLFLACLSLLLACDRVKEDKLPEPQTVSTYKVREGKPVLINLFKRHNLSNSATFELKGLPTNGKAQFVENGLLMYSPTGSVSAMDEVQYAYCADGNCQTQTLKLEIVSQTTPLTDTLQNCVYLYADVVTLTIPLSLSADISIPVLSNDFFCVGTSPNVASLAVAFAPKRGTASVQNNAIKYTYNNASSSNINPDYFIYQITQNGTVYYGVAVINLQFQGAPCPILAKNDRDSVAIGQTRFIDAFYNDTLCADSLQSITIVTPPAQGTVTIAPNNKGFYYACTASMAGTDSFVYRLTRKNGTYSEATVSLWLYVALDCSSPYRAINDVFLVSKSQFVNNQITLDGLTNDIYCPATFASANFATGIQNGLGSVQSVNKKIVYTLPNANFTGRVLAWYGLTMPGASMYSYATIIVTD